MNDGALGALKAVIVPLLVTVLAVLAGAIHLAHNYLPIGMPAGATAGPPAGAPQPPGGADGLMGLLMPYLSQVFVLNFVAYAGLAVLFVIAVRSASRLRVLIDGLLVLLSVGTLYAWNAMGRSNPYGTGTLALIVELALIVLAVVDGLRNMLVRRAGAPASR